MNKEGAIAGMIAGVLVTLFYVFAHKGIFSNGVEDTESEEAQHWNKSTESYSFIEKDGGTQLSVELEIEEQYADMFTEMWPRALKKLKEVSEK